MNIVATWNSFVWPMVTVQDDNLQVITVGHFRLTQSPTSATTGDTSVYGPHFAGYVLASLPLLLLFLFTSKYYIEGLMSSGLRL